MNTSRRIFGRLAAKLFPTWYKEYHELSFWRKLFTGGQLSREHYPWFYTRYFDLEPGFYEGKRILDIGCGPEWHLVKPCFFCPSAIKLVAVGDIFHSVAGLIEQRKSFRTALHSAWFSAIRP